MSPSLCKHKIGRPSCQPRSNCKLRSHLRDRLAQLGEPRADRVHIPIRLRCRAVHVPKIGSFIFGPGFDSSSGDGSGHHNTSGKGHFARRLALQSRLRLVYVPNPTQLRRGPPPAQGQEDKSESIKPSPNGAKRRTAGPPISAWAITSYGTPLMVKLNLLLPPLLVMSLSDSPELSPAVGLHQRIAELAMKIMAEDCSRWQM